MNIVAQPGGEFFKIEMEPDADARFLLLEAIGRHGMRGAARDAMREDPRFGLRVVAEIDTANEWSRSTVEIAHDAITEEDAALADLKTGLATALNQRLAA